MLLTLIDSDEPQFLYVVCSVQYIIKDNRYYLTKITQ